MPNGKTKSKELMTGHWTKAQLQAKADAEASLKTRPEISLPTPTILLDQYPDALLTWKRIVTDAEVLGLLDNLDLDALTDYCVMSWRLTQMQKKIATMTAEDDNFYVISKEMRAIETIKLDYEGKFGMTPESRLRIACKRAQVPKKTKEEEEADALYG